MHTTFVTPPDFVENILIVDASKEQILATASYLKTADTPYVVYLYSEDMEDLNWLSNVAKRVDTVLQAEDSQVPILQPIKFGPNQNLLSPAQYFTK